MNIKSFLRKRRFFNLSKTYFDTTKRAIIGFLRLTFAKRQILFVTNEKITTLTLGPVSQLCIFLMIGWVINLFIQSLEYNKIIGAKSAEIARLKNVTSYFETEFENVNGKLKKVKEYLVLTNGEIVPASNTEHDLEMPKNFQESSLSPSDTETLEKIKLANEKILDIKQITAARTKKIENTIAKTGLNVKKTTGNNIASLQKNYPKIKTVGASGGPLVPLENISAARLSIRNFSDSKIVETAKFANEIDRLIVLEKLMHVMPLSRPIKTYFLSSGFGARIDPFNRRLAMHQGLDFVGPDHEKIISPSAGRIIIAGKFGDYGNAVVIDHGFGITTRYGHLSKIKVRAGQIVKKGDILALQGSTGRSTGQHLHYEVRYKNNPLNPRRFIEAGDSFFNDITHKKHYANS